MSYSKKEIKLYKEHYTKVYISYGKDIKNFWWWYGNRSYLHDEHTKLYVNFDRGIYRWADENGYLVVDADNHTAEFTDKFIEEVINGKK